MRLSPLRALSHGAATHHPSRFAALAILAVHTQLAQQKSPPQRRSYASMLTEDNAATITMVAAEAAAAAAPSEKDHDDDSGFMDEALREAERAFAAGEVPIGAILVRGGNVVARACNQVETLQDASAHAEMLCARAGAAAAGSWRLSEHTLYCTVEPCPMCMAALHAFRIERLVYGAPNPRMGAVVSALRPAGEAANHSPYHTLSITGGVQSERCGELMKSFFRRRRGDAPYGSSGPTREDEAAAGPRDRSITND